MFVAAAAAILVALALVITRAIKGPTVFDRVLAGNSVGTLAIMLLAVVGFLQIGTLEMALLIGGVALFINTLEGNLLTPWLTSRSSRMNPVVIFVGVLAFGWLWGIWGLLLGPPLLMAVKSVCDRVDELKPVGELLGE